MRIDRSPRRPSTCGSSGSAAIAADAPAGCGVGRESAGDGATNRAAKRVLFVVTKLDQGGAMVVPLQVAQAFRDRGIVAETWFLYLAREAYGDHDGVRVLYPGPADGLLAYLRIFLALVRAMRSFRPDAVHGVLPLGNVFGLSAALLSGCRIRVASQHNPAPTHHPFMRILDLICGWLGVYTGNIACSQSVRDSYGRYPAGYRQRMDVVRNGVEQRSGRLDTSRARARWGLPQDGVLIGNAGRICDQKNQLFLVDVMERVPEAQLAIAGDGDQAEALCWRIRTLGLDDRITFLGAVASDEMPEFLNAVDVFLFPSRYEGLPLGLVEALQAGLTIVASDIPPNREVLVRRGAPDAGLLLPIDDAGRWATSIRGLIDDSELRQSYATAARRHAVEFSMTSMVDGYQRALIDAAE